MANIRNIKCEMREACNLGLLSFLFFILLPIHSLAEASVNVHKKNLNCFTFKIFEQFQIAKRVDGAIKNIPLTNYFGTPKEVKEWEEPDSRDPSLTVRKTQWLFHGVRILLDTPLPSSRKNPTIWLNRVEISTPRYKLCQGLKVGQPLSAFIKLLGEPELPLDLHAGKVIYEAQNFQPVGGIAFAGQATITLNVDKEMNISSISWQYWAD